jgi:ATP adenylyltransferase
LLQSAPYNLLVARRWMLLVPRSAEYVEGVSVNALGFVGSLFVRNAAQMQVIQTLGPMTLLQRAAVPCV